MCTYMYIRTNKKLYILSHLQPQQAENCRSGIFGATNAHPRVVGVL